MTVGRSGRRGRDSHRAADRLGAGAPGGSHGRAHGRVRPDIFSVPRSTVYGHLDQNTVGSRPGAHHHLRHRAVAVNGKRSASRRRGAPKSSPAPERDPRLWTHSAYWQLPELPPSRKRSGRLAHRVERSRDDHGWPDCRSPFTARRHHVDAWVRHLGLDPQPRTGRPAGPATIAELRPPPGGRVDCPLPGGQRPPAEVSEDPACLWAAVRRTVSGCGRFGRGRELGPFAFPPPCAPGHPPRRLRSRRTYASLVGGVGWISASGPGKTNPSWPSSRRRWPSDILDQPSGMSWQSRACAQQPESATASSGSSSQEVLCCARTRTAIPGQDSS